MTREDLLKSRIAVLIAVIAAAVMLSALWRRREGGSCWPFETACIGKATALKCHEEKFVKVACKGPRGCVEAGDRRPLRCDTSVASLGDPCMGEDNEYACSPDKKRAFVCKHGRFALHLECRGNAGCSISYQGYHGVSCDQSIAVEGDPCETDGTVACSEDMKHMLMCRMGRFELRSYCRGKLGCFMKGETPSCDTTLSLAGDP
jgi:hypothetical protein